MEKGKIEFTDPNYYPKPAIDPVQVIKPDKRRLQFQERMELSLLKLYMEKHRHKVKEFAQELEIIV